MILDYIQEELLRQRRVLAALMTGGDEDTREAANAAGTAEPTSGRESLTAVLEAVMAGTWEDGTVDGGTVAEVAAQSVREKLARTAELPGTAVSQSPAETRESSGASAARNTAVEQRETIPVSRRQGGAAPLWADAQMTGGGDAAAVWAAAGGGTQRGADVREMSRAVQRDARRYDGGFSIS
jgi:hypothetical protein